jgi:hypothetical protein
MGEAEAVASLLLTSHLFLNEKICQNVEKVSTNKSRHQTVSLKLKSVDLVVYPVFLLYNFFSNVGFSKYVQYSTWLNFICIALIIDYCRVKNPGTLPRQTVVVPTEPPYHPQSCFMSMSDIC